MDLRQVGSGNIGAANMARTLGKTLGLLVLGLDLIKGFVPVIIYRRYFALHMNSDTLIAVMMIFPVLGHMLTPILHFRGGKGVATALGTTLAVSPIAALIGVLIYAGIYALFNA